MPPRHARGTLRRRLGDLVEQYKHVQRTGEHQHKSAEPVDILQPLEAKVEHQQDCVHHLLSQIQGRNECKDQVWMRTTEEG